MEMSFAVRRMDGPAEKSACVRSVLARLPEWFGDAAAVAGYARQAAGLACWAAEMDGQCAGILAAGMHYGHTGEVAVCGVLPELHGKGLGRALYLAAEQYFRAEDCRYARWSRRSATRRTMRPMRARGGSTGAWALKSC